jgi:serralysin
VINIGTKGEIKAATGIFSGGLGMAIDNKGQIDGSQFGIHASEAVDVENSGEIGGMTAVLYSDNAVPGSKFHNVLENHKGGEILGGFFGVDFYGEGRHTLVDDGFIAGMTAVKVSSGIAHIVNHGRIDGIVEFSDGNNYLDTRIGKINGEVRGGTGNDTYVVSKAHINIVEGLNSGYDTVKSDASHTLGDNIDRLLLIGKGDIDGKGNDGDNFTRGNAGDNHLKGLAGSDILGGGKGNDILTGGVDADAFVFYKGDGKDVITDFQHGTDGISLLNFNGADNFDEVSNHMADHGKNLWITYGDDTLILRGVHEADLDTNDFHFSVVF